MTEELKITVQNLKPGMLIRVTSLKKKNQFGRRNFICLVDGHQSGPDNWRCLLAIAKNKTDEFIYENQYVHGFFTVLDDNAIIGHISTTPGTTTGTTPDHPDAIPIYRLPGGRLKIGLGKIISRKMAITLFKKMGEHLGYDVED